MSYDFRKDVRSDKQFEKDMDDNHTEESKILEHFNDLMTKSGLKGGLIPGGVAADGAVVENATHKEIRKADSILTLDTVEYPVEIHHVNFDKMATYKYSQLSRYNKSKYFVLMYCRTSGKGKDFTIDDGIEIHLFGKSTLEALLEITPNCKMKTFGFKPAIRLKGGKFDAIYHSPFQMKDFSKKKFKEWLAKRIKEESYEKG